MRTAHTEMSQVAAENQKFWSSLRSKGHPNPPIY